MICWYYYSDEKEREKTDRLSLYIKTRTKKDGTIPDKESANIIVSIYFS